MKKTLSILLVLLMIFSFAACGQKEEPAPQPDSSSEQNSETEQQPLAPGTITVCTSLDELNKAAGSKLAKAPVMGTEDIAFSFVTGDPANNVPDMAEYTFRLNGMEYIFRFAKDVSSNVTYFDKLPGGGAFNINASAIVEYGTTGDFKAARWASFDGQYVLFALDDYALESEQFESMTGELMALTYREPTAEEAKAVYDALAGDYQDRWSERAMATFKSNGDSLSIEIHWSSSASEYTKWTMTAKLGTPGALVYTDGACYTCVSDSEGKETETAVYEKQSGYLEYNEFDMMWTGAYDEDCKKCIFEQMK